MPKCKTCIHPDIDDINKALVEGRSYRDIARQFNVSRQSVYRHSQVHLPSSLVKAHEIEQVVKADDLLGQIKDLQVKTLTILDDNTGKDDRIALTAIREARSNIDLLGRLLGELDDAPKVAVLVNNPEWQSVRSAIVDALQPYSEARKAVTNALQRLGA